MLKKRGLLFILLFMLLILSFSSIYAESFDIELLPIKTEIMPDEKAEYILTITNNQNTTDIFYLKFPPTVYWRFLTEPIRASGIFVDPGETKNTTIKVIPIKDAEIYPMTYKIYLNIISENEGRSVEKIFQLTYRTYHSFLYETEPSIELGEYVVEVDGKETYDIDPRKLARLKLYIKNRNLLEIKDLNINLKSLYFEKNIKIDLAPFERRTEEIDLKYPSTLLPNQDTLTISLELGNKTFGSESFDLNIVGYKENFTVDIMEDKSLFKKKITLELSNPGTLTSSQQITYNIGRWEGLFSSSEPDGHIIRANGKGYYIWNVTLDPGAHQILTVTINYYPIVYIIIILIIIISVLLVLFLKSISPIAVTKKIEISRLKDGAVAEIKVIVTLKNRKNTILKDIIVKDNVPSLMEYIEIEAPGILKPTRIVKHKRGTLLEWFIKQLEEHEERIIVYTLTTQFAVLGRIKLGKVKTSFRYKGKEWLIESKELE